MCKRKISLLKLFTLNFDILAHPCVLFLFILFATTYFFLSLYSKYLLLHYYTASGTSIAITIRVQSIMGPLLTYLLELLASILPLGLLRARHPSLSLPCLEVLAERVSILVSFWVCLCFWLFYFAVFYHYHYFLFIIFRHHHFE